MKLWIRRESETPHRELISRHTHHDRNCVPARWLPLQARLPNGNVVALQRPNVLSLPALRSFGDFELYTLAFLQAAEAACLDGREVYENIFATLPADKAVPFRVVKPLYCSLFCHVVTCILFKLFTLEGSRRY